MSDYLQGKNVRLRCRKSYPGAHTHIIIGKVEEENSRYIAVKGRAFHFSRLVDGMRNQVHTGIAMVRIIPWENVEVIHWLGAKVDWNADFDFDKNGNLVLLDKGKTVIAEKRDGME